MDPSCKCPPPFLAREFQAPMGAKLLVRTQYKYESYQSDVNKTSRNQPGCVQEIRSCNFAIGLTGALLVAVTHVRIRVLGGRLASSLVTDTWSIEATCSTPISL